MLAPPQHIPQGDVNSRGLQTAFSKLELRFHLTGEKSEDRESRQSCMRYWQWGKLEGDQVWLH